MTHVRCRLGPRIELFLLVADRDQIHSRPIFMILFRVFPSHTKTNQIKQAQRQKTDQAPIHHHLHQPTQQNSRKDCVDNPETSGQRGISGKLLEHGARLTHGPEVRQLQLVDLAGGFVLHLVFGVACRKASKTRENAVGENVSHFSALSAGGWGAVQPPQLALLRNSNRGKKDNYKGKDSSHYRSAAQSKIIFLHPLV